MVDRLRANEAASDVPEVEPGEGGEGGGAIATDPNLGYSGYGGSESYGSWNDQSGLSTLRIEAELLAIESINRIAAAIAGRVVRDGGSREVAIVGADFQAALRAHRQVAAQIDGIAAELEGAMPAADATMSATLGAVREVASVVGALATDVAQQGVRLTVQESVLHTSVGNALVERQVRTRMPERFPESPKPGGMLDRLSHLASLKSRAAQLSTAGSTDVDAMAGDTARAGAIAAVDELMGALMRTQGAAPALITRLLAADEVLSADPPPLLLTLEIVAAGGGYRRKKGVLVTIGEWFGVARMSYNAGAAVAFTLLDGGTLSLIGGGVAYYYTDHVVFTPRLANSFDSDNLTTVERAPTVVR